MLKRVFVLSVLASAVAMVNAQTINEPGLGLGYETPKTLIAGKDAAPPDMAMILADQVQGSKLGVNVMSEVPLIRAEAIQEAAASLGARAGLARRLHEIALSLNGQRVYLDKAYDFTKLALSIPLDSSQPKTSPLGTNGEYAMVLPPIVLDARDADSVPNEDEMRIADRVFKIHAKARLVPVDKRSGTPVMPNWRDYLMLSFQEVQMPHQSLLPRTDAEKLLWNEWAAKGWKQGVEQGQQMFDSGFARLNRDFHGMLKYRLAYAQGVVSAPLVAGVNMGVTGGGNEMRINDRVIRITDHSSLIPDSGRWLKVKPD